jgi:hypothetical protein
MLNLHNFQYDEGGNHMAEEAEAKMLQWIITFQNHNNICTYVPMLNNAHKMFI